MVNLNNIFDEDTDKDNLLIIIDYGKQKTKFFLKEIFHRKNYKKI